MEKTTLNKQIRVSEDLHKRVKMAAFTEGLTITEFVENALTYHVGSIQLKKNKNLKHVEITNNPKRK